MPAHDPPEFDLACNGHHARREPFERVLVRRN